MSQYPPPYSQPPYPQQPYPGQFDYYQQYAGDPLAPAKRASLLMFLIGALIGALSLCCVGVGALLPKLMAQQPDVFSKMKLPPEFTPEMFQTGMIAMGVVSLILAITMIVLGMFVRSGGIGSVVTSIVVTCLIIVGLLLFTLSTLLQMASGGAVEVLPTLCMTILPLALSVLLLVWLIQAARAAPRARMMQQAMAAQMWQYQQQAAAGWGYGTQQSPQIPPPPTPPATPPPGDPNGPPSQG